MLKICKFVKEYSHINKFKQNMIAHGRNFFALLKRNNKINIGWERESEENDKDNYCLILKKKIEQREW